MKVKMRQIFCGETGTFPPGAVLDVPDQVGRQLLDRKYAEEHTEVEAAASTGAPEQATGRRGKLKLTDAKGRPLPKVSETPEDEPAEE
jgi:hypothetical protein